MNVMIEVTETNNLIVRRGEVGGGYLPRRVFPQWLAFADDNPTVSRGEDRVIDRTVATGGH